MAGSTLILERLREQVHGEEFDHQVLLDAVRGCARPRDAVTRLLRAGVILRITPGIYVLGAAYRRRPYSREILANLIAGPSYVSFEYALQHHGLIPERVEAVTSAIDGRARRFETPAGLFLYKRVPERAFARGLQRIELAGSGYLIAGPEKALCDMVRGDRGLAVRNIGQMTTYLVQSLRIDLEELGRMDPEEVDGISVDYRSKQLRVLAATIRRLQRGPSGEVPHE